MKKIIAYILIFIAVPCLGQDDSVRRNFELGFILSPSLSFRMHSGLENKDYFDKDYPKFGYGAGLSLKFKLKNWCLVGTGVELFNFTYGRSTNFSTTIPSIPVTIRENFYWGYLMVPLSLELRQEQQKISPSLGVSISPSYMLFKGGEGSATYNNGEVKEYPYDGLSGNDKRFNLFAGASAGVAVKLTSKGMLKAEAVYSIGLLKIFHANMQAYDLYLWKSGINLSYVLSI